MQKGDDGKQEKENTSSSNVAPTNKSTTGSSLDTSKGGKPVGDPRMPNNNAEDQNAGGNKSSSGKSGNADNESILMQSGVVRLQRAARAELQRRNEKALEEAAAAAAAAANVAEKDRGSSGGNRNNSGANGARRTNANASANTFGSGGMSPAGAASTPRTSAINSSWMQKASRGPDEDDESKNRSVISLDQLNRNIEKRLNSRDKLWDSRASLPRVEGTVKPPVRDTMSSLLSYNHIRGDWRGHQSASTYNGKCPYDLRYFHFVAMCFSSDIMCLAFLISGIVVAVVFGKPLVRDQITVEYSSRIRTLARLFKNNPLFRPSLICFTGCIAPGNHVSDADAGYIFFRQ